MIDIKPATVTIDGITYTAELATAEGTKLGREDHGLMTANIYFAWPGGGQGTPGNILCEFDKDSNRRKGTAFGLDHIMQLIHAFGCDSWEAIKGRDAYILKTEPFGLIRGVMNAHDHEKYLIFETHRREWYPK